MPHCFAPLRLQQINPTPLSQQGELRNIRPMPAAAARGGV
jgi:hypothetical protein